MKVYNRSIIRKVKYVEVACQWCGILIKRAKSAVGPNFTCTTCKRDRARLISTMRYYTEKELNKQKENTQWEDFLNACEVKKAQVARDEALGPAGQKRVRDIKEAQKRKVELYKERVAKIQTLSLEG